jgi:hypothetical protein
MPNKTECAASFKRKLILGICRRHGRKIRKVPSSLIWTYFFLATNFLHVFWITRAYPSYFLSLISSRRNSWAYREKKCEPIHKSRMSLVPVVDSRTLSEVKRLLRLMNKWLKVDYGMSFMSSRHYLSTHFWLLMRSNGKPGYAVMIWAPLCSEALWLISQLIHRGQ